MGVSYGVPPFASSLNQYWPQPGSEEWGRGIVMVTTHDRRLVETASPFVKYVNDQVYNTLLFVCSSVCLSASLSYMHIL